MKSKYELLNDADWLHQRYIVEQLSTIKIGKLIGVKQPNSVRQALLANGISLRSVSDGLTCNRTDDGFVIEESVLTGCLLGDAGLQKWKKGSANALPAFYKKNKFYSHIKYVGELLFGDLWETRYKPEYRLLNGKNLLYHRINSLTHKELVPIYERWYPESNGYLKVVPDDIKIDAKVLLHWFMDDGSTSFRKDRGSIVATLCTESFSKEDQEKLVAKVDEAFGMKFTLKPVNFGTGWRIGIKSTTLPMFYDIIGPCPVPDLVYKWKVPG